MTISVQGWSSSCCSKEFAGPGALPEEVVEGIGKCQEMGCDIVLDMSAEELEELVGASAQRTTSSGARSAPIDVSACCSNPCAECFVSDAQDGYMMQMKSTTDCIVSEAESCGMVEARIGCTGACRMSPGLRLMNDIEHTLYGIKGGTYSNLQAYQQPSRGGATIRPSTSSRGGTTSTSRGGAATPLLPQTAGR